MRLMTLLILTAIAVIPAAGAADLSSPAGLWVPIENGKPLGLVRIFEQDGVFFGRIESSHVTPVRCTRCTDDRKNQPLFGMVVMRNLKPKNGEYSGGDVLNPRTGRVYDCKFHLTDGGERLQLRVYLGISLLGHSQTWERVKEADVTKASWHGKEKR